MSTFVKNYYSPKNPAIFLSVSWEMGYRDVHIRYNDRLIHSIPHPAVLIDGVKIQDEELGTIKIQFTSAPPKKLVIKVNGKKFKTVNKFYTYDYSGLVTAFTTLGIFAGIEAFIIAVLYDYKFSYTPLLIVFSAGILIALIYGLIVFLLMKKVSWAYFFGTGIFTITTILAAFDISFFLNTWANYIVFAIRLVILIYLLLQVKHILKELRKSSISQVEEDLLDS